MATDSYRPSSVLNSIFMSTVNMTAKMLISVASSSKADNTEKWKIADHLRFMVMLITWLMAWELRVMMDLFPWCLSSSPDCIVGGSSPSVGLFQVASYSSSAEAEELSLPSSGSWIDVDGSGAKALVKSLTHVLALVNEVPASSKKYQFIMAMAEKIMEDNARHGHSALLHVNRTALASSFTRTSTLLHRCLQRQTSPSGDYGDSWLMRVIKAIPFGFCVASYVKAIAVCFDAAYSLFDAATVRYRGRNYGGDR